jgi:hypothetical protein
VFLIFLWIKLDHIYYISFLFKKYLYFISVSLSQPIIIDPINLSCQSHLDHTTQTELGNKPIIAYMYELCRVNRLDRCTQGLWPSHQIMKDNSIFKVWEPAFLWFVILISIVPCGVGTRSAREEASLFIPGSFWFLAWYNREKILHYYSTISSCSHFKLSAMFNLLIGSKCIFNTHKKSHTKLYSKVTYKVMFGSRVVF